MIIAIHFDGTIVDDQFPEIGKMIPGAKENINKLYYEGYTIIIWSCRTGIKKARAIEWLVLNGIKFHRFNQSCPTNIALHGGKDTRKVFANLYIDDRGLTFPMPCWDDIYKIVHERFPTYGEKVARDGFL